MTSKVTEAFAQANDEDRAALVGYLPAGFPSTKSAIEAALAMPTRASTSSRWACRTPTR